MLLLRLLLVFYVTLAMPVPCERDMRQAEAYLAVRIQPSRAALRR